MPTVPTAPPVAIDHSRRFCAIREERRKKRLTHRPAPAWWITRNGYPNTAGTGPAYDRTGDPMPSLLSITFPDTDQGGERLEGHLPTAER
jgi:hypothetical protein